MRPQRTVGMMAITASRSPFACSACNGAVSSWTRLIRVPRLLRSCYVGGETDLEKPSSSLTSRLPKAVGLNVRPCPYYRDQRRVVKHFQKAMRRVPNEKGGPLPDTRRLGGD